MSFEKQKPLAAIKEKNGKWELQKSKQISHESKSLEKMEFKPPLEIKFYVLAIATSYLATRKT